MSDVSKNFYDDLRIGALAEVEYADMINGIATPIGRKFYDVVDPDLNTHEVKFDKAFNLYGNFAFEIRCKGKLSGLSITSADYWVHTIGAPNQFIFYQIPTVSLKEYLKKNMNVMGLTIKSGIGDDQSSQCIICPPYHIKRMPFKILK